MTWIEWAHARLEQREDPHRDREEAFRRHALAHESVVSDWTKHRDERPEGVREELWKDPLYDPDNPSEIEKRFLRTRRKRRQHLRWSGYDA